MIEKINIIDYIGINKETQNCCLSILDSHNWNDELNHLITLQEKLNSYIRFIESEEIFDEYPLAKGKKIEILIYFKYTPSVNCKKFLENSIFILNNININLKYRTT